MSFFASVEQLPEDPIFGLGQIFQADPHPHKVNLSIGAYRDNDGKPKVFECVRKAEKLLLDAHMNKEYLAISGDPVFLKLILQEALGKALYNTFAERVFPVQTVGGTGALRVGMEFLSRNGIKSIYLPDPTWPTHRLIAHYAAMKIHNYPYYNQQRHAVDFPALCNFYRSLQRGSVVLLHACCHNPTGADFSEADWHELSQLIKERGLLPFFDMAYQGLGHDLERDASSVRYFLQQGHEMLIALSYAKNFGLYGERVGALAVVCQDSTFIPRVSSQLKQITRATYSNCPLHGSRIVTTILQSESLTQEWKAELKQVRERIQNMRYQLVEKLKKAVTHCDMTFLEDQQGMFSYTDLSEKQVLRLREEFSIYLTGNGRASIAGLTQHNIDYVAQAIAKVLQ